MAIAPAPRPWSAASPRAVARPWRSSSTCAMPLRSAPKAALESLIRGIAAEEGRHGIRANMVGVGAFSDGMFHKLVETGDFDDKFIDSTKRAVALGRFGTATEIANAVDF